MGKTGQKTNTLLALAVDFWRLPAWEQVAILKSDFRRNKVITEDPIVLTLIIALFGRQSEVRQVAEECLKKCVGNEDNPVKRIFQSAEIAGEDRAREVLMLLDDLSREYFDLGELHRWRNKTQLFWVQSWAEEMMLKHYEEKLSVNTLKSFSVNKNVGLALLRKFGNKQVTWGNFNLLRPLFRHGDDEEISPLFMGWFRCLPKTTENKEKLLIEVMSDKKESSFVTGIIIAVLLEQYGSELKMEQVEKIIESSMFPWVWNKYFAKAWDEWVSKGFLTDVEILELEHKMSAGCGCAALGNRHWQMRLLRAFGIGVGYVCLDYWRRSRHEDVKRLAIRLWVKCVSDMSIVTLLGIFKKSSDDVVENMLQERIWDGQINAKHFEQLIPFAFDGNYRVRKIALDCIDAIPIEEIVEEYGYDNLFLLAGSFSDDDAGQKLRSIICRKLLLLSVETHKEHWSSLLHLLNYKNGYVTRLTGSVINHFFVKIFGKGRRGYRSCWDAFQNSVNKCSRSVFGGLLLIEYSDKLSIFRLRKLAQENILREEAGKILLKRALDGKVRAFFKG